MQSKTGITKPDNFYCKVEQVLLQSGLDVLQRRAAFLHYKAGQVVYLNQAVFIKWDIDHKVGQYKDQKKFGQKKFPSSISLIIC